MRSSGPIGSHSSPAGGAPVLRADLHVHSAHSGRRGCAGEARGSAPADPEAIDRAARGRGMDLVTLTDIDTIDGCRRFLETHPAAAHFFLSEEVRAREPRVGAEVRVLLYGITEAAHREAQRLKGDVRELIAWARREAIPAALGPSPDLLGPGGSAETLRGLARLFDLCEARNPAWGRSWGTLVTRLAQEADPGRTSGLTAGSGGAAGTAGRVCTLARAADASGYLRELRAGRVWAAGGVPGVVGYAADILKALPLPRAAAPIWNHTRRRALLGVRARRARRQLDQVVLRQFQVRARSFGAGEDSRPGDDRTDTPGFD